MTYQTIALDPGKRIVYGAAFNEEGHAVSLIKFDPAAHWQREETKRVVIEKPNINSNTINWQDVLDVAWSGALVAGRLGGIVTEYTPVQWKGTTSKPVHHGRIWALMHDDERALFPADVPAVIQAAKESFARTGKVVKYSHSWHNHLDAIGLGLFFLGRSARGGAPAR